MSSSRVQSFLAFYALLDRLCCLPRTGWTLHPEIGCVESVADHSYATACVALDSSVSLDPQRRTRLVCMMLLHDLAESIVGDIIPESLSKVSAAEKRMQEASAMRELVLLLCNSGLHRMGALYKELFTMYEDAHSPLARAAHVIDKIDMLCQAHCYSARYNVNLERFFTNRIVETSGDPKDSDRSEKHFLCKLFSLYKGIHEQYSPPVCRP